MKFGNISLNKWIAGLGFELGIKSNGLCGKNTLLQAKYDKEDNLI